MEKIMIKFHVEDIEKPEKIEKGDWVDLRAAEEVSFKKGEYGVISLGVSMKLPPGYEAHILPRSSTFKNFGIIAVNSMGVIDNSYSGTNDIWRWPVIAGRDTVIHKGDRICQFRIMEKQPEFIFVECDELDSVDRGGLGSTGVK